MDLITEDLAGLHILGRPLAEQLRVTDRVLYGLDADRIDFVTTTSSREPMLIDGSLRRSSVSEVGYVCRSNPNDDEFLELFRREDFGVDELPFQSGTYTFLSDRVKSFTVEVFNMDGDEGEVITEWGSDKVTDTTHKGLPASVVITLTLENTPRLLQEQIEFQSTARMTVTYQRTVRFPQGMRKQESELAFLAIPAAPSDDAAREDANGEDPSEDIKVGGAANGAGGGGLDGRGDGGGSKPGDAGGSKPGGGGGGIRVQDVGGGRIPK
jgi:hypothetical protein